MAITRSQQAKQMLQNGGMLVKPSTDGKRPGYRSAKFQSARERAMGPQSTFSSEIEDETTPQDRQEVQKEREILRYVPTGGEQKDQSEIVKRQKEKYEKQFYDKGQVPPLGSRPTSFKTKLDQRNKQKRLNYINNLIKNRRKKIIDAIGLAGIEGVTEENFDELYNKGMLNIPSVSDLVEQGFYKSDGPFATGEKIPSITSIRPPGVIGLFTKSFESPLTTEGIDKLLQENIDLQNLRTTEGLEGTTFNELMKTYEPNRFKREYGDSPDDRGPDQQQTDPCKGPNPPAYCFIGNNVTEETDPTNIFAKAGITPRIAGSLFAADGGLADMDREAFLLGGIAKGLKKAVRGVKKIAKSPLGKAALIGAGFGLAGMGPFKGLAGTSFGKGFAGLKGTLFGQAGSRVGEAFVPYKEGLFTKLGLTKGGGSLIPTFKGGITLASILPLLIGKTEEEKDDILKEYYASQSLNPSQSVRGVGSEFDFYKYNLAEGGTPRKEPVAKKVMPLLDMGGMEKDYRAEGGFVPIGRMEKADDVPARLSKNEFVFTADAVRNAGDGDVDKGAEVMYNMMKNLEAGGEVSEESQGLDGAREMFQTSQRLGEVI
jgi:hypothetical protein